MKKIILIIFLFSIHHEFNAQLNYSWANRFGGTGNESVNKMRTDNAGNIYVIGSFRNTVDFDPGPGLANRTSAGGDDIFFAKYSATGNFLWVNAIGTASDDLGYDLKTDAAGHVYVCGSFAYGNQSADFDPGPGVATLTSMGNIDAWFGEYDTNGNYIWAHNVASQNNDHGPCISVDAAGEVYIGVMCSTVGIDFDPGPGVATLPVVAPWNFALAKYTTAGNYLWCGNLSTNGAWHWMTDMENDATGNLYVTGYFSGATNFNMRGGTNNLTPFGGYDACLAAYDPTGALLWARQAGGTQDDFGQGLAINQANNAVYWTGQYKVTSNFNVSGGGFNMTAVGNGDGFIAKYALGSGNYIWAKSIGGSGDDSPVDIRLDNCENVYITGGFDSPTADFDPGPGVANRNTLGSYDVFYSKYSDMGCYLGASSFGGAGSDFSSSVVVNPASLNILLSNYFNGTADFDPGAGTANLVSAGAQDAFIAEYTQTSSQVPAPTNTTPAANLTVCPGQTTTLTVTSNLCAGGTRVWYNAATNGSHLGSGNTFVTPPIMANTTFYVGDSICGGMSTRLAIAVSVGGSSTLTPTSNSPVCEGSAITLSVSTVGTYTWTGPGSYSNNTQNPTITNASSANAGTYSISVTNASGCILSGTVSVSILSASITIQSISSNSICSGQSSVITPAGASTYTINPGGQTGSSFTVSPTTTTQYSITGTNVASCIVNNTLTPTIYVTQTPTVSVSSATSMCSGQSKALTAAGATTYTWSPAATLNTSSGATVTATPLSTSSYTVIGSTGTCTNSAQTTLSVIATPTLIVNSATVCAGQTATLTASGASSYTWNTGQNTASVNLNPAATTVYTVTGVNGGICSSGAQATVSVTQNPTLTVSSSTTICSGQSKVLSAAGASSYTWSPAASLSASSGASVTANPTSTLTYTVVGSTGTCSNSAQTTLSVTPTPTVAVNSATLCAGQSATLTATGASTYTWNTGQNTASISISPATTTGYTVSGSNGGACTASAQAVVVIVQYPAVLSSSITNVLCYGASNGSITVNSSGASGFSWSPNASSSNVASGLTAGVYTCTLSTNAGCNTVRSFTITEPAAINGVLTSSNTSCGLCNGSATAIASGGTGAYHYSWQPGGASQSAVTNLCAQQYTLTISDDNNCKMVYFADIQSSALFTATISTSAHEIYQGESAIINSGKGNTYAWIPNAYLQSSNSSSVSVSPMEDATFCVRITDTLGCVDTACVDILIKCGDVFIPTAFSPNNDGHNDELKVYSNCLQEIVLRIYDRWGEIVFEGTDVSAAWDGSYRGAAVNAGVFVYQLSAKTKNGDTISKKGNITLVR